MMKIHVALHKGDSVFFVIVHFIGLEMLVNICASQLAESYIYMNKSLCAKDTLVGYFCTLHSGMSYLMFCFVLYSEAKAQEGFRC